MIIRLSDGAKKRCQKSFKMLPNIFTFLNALFGFFAIVKALEGSVVIAGYYIMLAALMDACDGRLARVLKVTSCFGAELDSLADAISFCLAPVILVYCWYPSPLGFAGLAILGLYLCAGLARLARFNSNPVQPLYYFQGLPTTVAAFCIASFPTSVFVHQKITLSLVMGLALLMISHVPFPSFKKGLRVRVYEKILALILALCFLFLLIKGYPVPFIPIAAFISGVVFYNALFRLKGLRRALLFLIKKLH